VRLEGDVIKVCATAFAIVHRIDDVMTYRTEVFLLFHEAFLGTVFGETVMK